MPVNATEIRAGLKLAEVGVKVVKSTGNQVGQFLKKAGPGDFISAYGFCDDHQKRKANITMNEVEIGENKNDTHTGDHAHHGHQSSLAPVLEMAVLPYTCRVYLKEVVGGKERVYQAKLTVENLVDATEVGLEEK